MLEGRTKRTLTILGSTEDCGRDLNFSRRAGQPRVAESGQKPGPWPSRVSSTHLATQTAGAGDQLQSPLLF